MKCDRPLFVFSFSILAGMYLAITMPRNLLYGSLALFALFTVFHAFTARVHTASLIICITGICVSLVGLFLFSRRLNDKIVYLESLGEGTARGTVTDMGSSYTYYTVKINDFNGNKMSGVKVNVYTDDLLEEGDEIIMTGRFKGFSPKANYRYNYSKGVWSYFYADEIKSDINSGPTFEKYFYNLRQNLVSRLKKLYDTRTVPVAAAMGYGDKSLLGTSVSSSFRYAGMSHALVVSGLHVGFIVAALNRIMYFIPVKKKLKNLVLIAFVCLFMRLIGFTPSIIRAGALVISYLAGRTFEIETDGFSTLAVIILVSVVSNPYSAVNVSLLLSYCAYFGVVCAASLAKKYSVKPFLSALGVSRFAVLFTCPVMAFAGMETTLLSPAFNTAMSAVIMAVCVLSFFSGLADMIPFVGHRLALIISALNKTLINILLDVAELAEKYMGFALINLGQESAKVVIICTMVIVSVAVVQRLNVKKVLILRLCVPLMSFLCYNYANSLFTTVKVFDGGSETAFIISGGGENILVSAYAPDVMETDEIISENNLTGFDKIIVCCENPKEELPCPNDTCAVIDKSGEYEFSCFTLLADIYEKGSKFTIKTAGTDFSFCHGEVDYSADTAEYFFFGSDCPKNVSAQNIYYFYPLLKSQTVLAAECDAQALYGPLTVKIHNKTGKNYIIKDVKNFGYGV